MKIQRRDDIQPGWLVAMDTMVHQDPIHARLMPIFSCMSLTTSFFILDKVLLWRSMLMPKHYINLRLNGNAPMGGAHLAGFFP